MKQSMLSTTVVFDLFYGQGLVRALMSRSRFRLQPICGSMTKTQGMQVEEGMYSLLSETSGRNFENLSRHYIPGPFITIDEQLVLFRGTCSFLQYLPSKPDRHGLKIFWATDSENNYPLVAEPYLGRVLGTERLVNLGRNVALRLATPSSRLEEM